MINISEFNKSEKLESFGDLELWKLGLEWLEPFNQFVEKVYYNSRSKKYRWGANEIKELTADSEYYFPRTKLCAVLTREGRLLATWGLILKEIGSANGFHLPIEKKFKMSLEDINRKMETNAHYFFNGWRTAVDKELLIEKGYDKSTSIFLLDILLRGLSENFKHENTAYMGVAEMENVVLRYHKRIGVPWHKLGQPKTYWGSQKFPCAFRLEDYEENMKLNHPDRYRFIYKAIAL